ncbi:glycyl-radical enzyme activating protein [Clostridium transplantifaecale]|uniref:glycyl-radical enzyme activating protein n=1 Tax=Clostridium transplantifaecale TaxID=2479838 RepID=UPI000F63EB77|nr:glycyl-radical enzyme activating protein [Clostridium transplantifaecale]
MEKTGVIFDIKQFAVFDGPGIRTTVFLKGCPLRCMWCHNPEGLSYKPQLMVSPNGCTDCGSCRLVCKHPDGCMLCGDCVRACPARLRKICGERMTVEALTGKLLRDREYLEMQGGGVTFSGGEPTGQPEFLLNCLKELRTMHRAVETSGYCRTDIFKNIIDELDYIIMDIKIADDEIHKIYTGVSNRIILENLEQVKKSGKPFRIRIPVIPGVNDTEENYRLTAELLKGAENLEMVELLPYHKTAGAKYSMVGRAYAPDFDVDREPVLETSAFENAGICCHKM